MDLLYITEDNYPPFRVDVVELVAIEMPRYGHTIDWLMQKGEDNETDMHLVKWYGHRVYLTRRSKIRGIVGKVLNALYNSLGKWHAIHLARQRRYDIIQVRDNVLAGIPGLIAAWVSGAKFCFWMSYPYPEAQLYSARCGLSRFPLLDIFRGSLGIFLLYKIILPLADHVFVQSDQMLLDVSRRGIQSEKITSVPMGIKESEVLSEDAAHLPNCEAPEILYLGTLLRVRRLDFLVRVLSKVVKHYPKARLKFVGNGSEPEDYHILTREIERLNLADNVVFTGFVPMEEAWEHVRKADICVSPFYPIPILLSTSPTKLIEYMAMAKIVVANDHPEQSRIMKESGVGETIPWEEQAFADKIIDILDHPDEARKKASKGPNYIRRHRTYSVISRQLDQAYREFLA